MKEFDFDCLDLWFLPKNTLFRMFNEYRLGKAKKHRRLFFDNGNKVLLVAHIDTVLEPKIHNISKRTVHAQGLDDRLGCAIGHWIMKYLPVDLLLCDYEESGASTAQYHEIKDSYNFIIELDRAGKDFVDYDGLAEQDMINDIEVSSDMNIGWGSFSDICFMDTKKIGAVNWGIGYRLAHSNTSYAAKKDIHLQIKRLWEFIETFQDRPYKEGIKSRYNWRNRSISLPVASSYMFDGKWYDYETGQETHIPNASSSDAMWYVDNCDWCGKPKDRATMVNYVCEDCITAMKEYRDEQKYKKELQKWADESDDPGNEIDDDDIPPMAECADCRKWVGMDQMLDGVCADCDGLFLVDNDEDYETYKVMLDGTSHEVRYKNEKCS